MNTKKIISADVKGVIKKALKDFKVSNSEYKHFPLSYNNWGSGSGNAWKWRYTKINIADDNYIVEDKELTDKDFYYMLNGIISELGINAKTHFNIYEPYLAPVQYTYKGLSVFGKPCKEFTKFVNYLHKKREKQNGEYIPNIGFDTIWTERVCGKRSSWSASRRGYLAYQPKPCTEWLEAIKSKCASNDRLSISIEETMDKEDDYECAMYNESEWYGTNCNLLHVTITTPTGRVKLDRNFVCNYQY